MRADLDRAARRSAAVAAAVAAPARVDPAGATDHPALTELARLLNLPLELAQLDGDVLFAPPTGNELDLREWITFAQAREADQDDGLVFVNAPLGAQLRRSYEPDNSTF